MNELRNSTRWRTQKRWPEASVHNIEAEIFLGFYAIRKLIEAKQKLSFNVLGLQTSAQEFKAKGKKVQLRNWDKIDELYDLENGKPHQISLKDFCDSIVHSFVFVPACGPDGFDGIFFNTDRQKDKLVWFVKSDRLQKLFETVSQDYIDHTIMERDSKGDFVVTHASKDLAPALKKRIKEIRHSSAIG